MNKQGALMGNVCSETIIHPQAVKTAKINIPAAEEITALGGYFKMLGDPTRLKILYALYGGELCVCDLGSVLGMTVSAVSHQLSALRQAHMVTFRRDGKVVFYKLHDNHVKRILQSLRIHLSE
jgi:DNA-binding transcriptional ArsR family regulator